MKIELRNIKYSGFASEETHCYEASLYVDGKKIGQVSNDGHGGADYFYPVKPADRETYEKANAWVMANMPGETYTSGGVEHTLSMNIEYLCAELVNEFLSLRDLKRQLKTKIVMQEKGKIYTLKLRAGGDMARAVEQVKVKYPTAVVLNGMPEAEALRIYRGK